MGRALADKVNPNAVRNVLRFHEEKLRFAKFATANPLGWK